MKNPSCLSEGRKHTMPFLPGLVTDSLPVVKIQGEAYGRQQTQTLSQNKKNVIFALGQMVQLMMMGNVDFILIYIRSSHGNLFGFCV